MCVVRTVKIKNVMKNMIVYEDRELKIAFYINIYLII